MSRFRSFFAPPPLADTFFNRAYADLAGAQIENGPPAESHARHGPGESYHFHLKQGSEEGPRISSETFAPLTPEDERKFTGKYKRVIENLTDAEKWYIDKATRDIFHTGKISPRRSARDPRQPAAFCVAAGRGLNEVLVSFRPVLYAERRPIGKGNAGADRRGTAPANFRMVSHRGPRQRHHSLLVRLGVRG